MASNSVCSIDGCGKRHRARGWCSAHHAKWSKYGDPLFSVDRSTTAAPCVVDACHRMGSSTRMGMCGPHYKRQHRYGNPSAGSYFRTPNGVAHQWLIDHVDYQGGDCLEWPFADRGNGYGAVTEQSGRLVGAHAEMCRLAYGQRPSPEHQALHSCGKGHEGCVHPKHLRWGTAFDNMQDKNAHGTALSHGRHPNAKISADDVAIIRDSRGKIQQRLLAAKFGVCQAHVSSIQRGDCWR